MIIHAKCYSMFFHPKISTHIGLVIYLSRTHASTPRTPHTPHTQHTQHTYTTHKHAHTPPSLRGSGRSDKRGTSSSSSSASPRFGCACTSNTHTRTSFACRRRRRRCECMWNACRTQFCVRLCARVRYTYRSHTHANNTRTRASACAHIKFIVSSPG